MSTGVVWLILRSAAPRLFCRLGSVKISVPASPAILEFSNNCHDPKNGRFCSWMVTRKYARGILGKGRESHGHRQELCGKGAGASGLCAVRSTRRRSMLRTHVAASCGLRERRFSLTS